MIIIAKISKYNNLSSIYIHIQPRISYAVTVMPIIPNKLLVHILSNEHTNNHGVVHLHYIPTTNEYHYS